MTLDRVIALIEVFLFIKCKVEIKKKNSTEANKRNANIYSMIVSKAAIVYLGIK